RVWPLLNTVSFGMTGLTVLAWALRFYTPGAYLTTELFLTLYCAMFLSVLRDTRGATAPAVVVSRLILWTAPIWYYLASIAILSTHGVAFLVFLVALAVAGGIAGRRIGAGARLICWIAVYAPLAVWADTHAGRTWLVAGLAAVVGIYAINLISDLE